MSDFGTSLLPPPPPAPPLACCLGSCTRCWTTFWLFSHNKARGLFVLFLPTVQDSAVTVQSRLQSTLTLTRSSNPVFTIALSVCFSSSQPWKLHLFFFTARLISSDQVLVKTPESGPGLIVWSEACFKSLFNVHSSAHLTTPSKRDFSRTQVRQKRRKKRSK